MSINNIVDRIDSSLDRQINRVSNSEKVSIPMMEQPQSPKDMLKYLEHEDSTGYMRTRLAGGSELVAKSQILLGSLRNFVRK